MLTELSPSGNCFGLSLHPELTEYPAMQADERFSLYPNPSAGDFSLFFPNSASAIRKCELYNLNGRLVYQKTEVPGQRLYRIEAGELPPAVYIIKIIFDGHTEYRKLVRK